MAGFSNAKERPRASAVDDGLDGAGRRLMCTAQQCPERASVYVEGGSGLCSWHFANDPSAWPRVTESRLQAEAERLKWGSEVRNATTSDDVVQPMTKEDKLAVLASLRDALMSTPSTARDITWARTLARRHEAGERLTPAQISAYRGALRNEPRAEATGDWA